MRELLSNNRTYVELKWNWPTSLLSSMAVIIVLM